MKKVFVSIIGVVLIVTVWLIATPSSAAPLIGRPSAYPAVLATQTSTTVTVTIPIPDSSLIPNSVNLLRLGGAAPQPTILGVMHDDGLNGDAVAGDGIYTLLVTFHEPSAETFKIEASAAFRGLLKRVITSPITIAVTSNASELLPPDPGPAGMTTLAGIDSDGDGVRDDVQRYIALNYSSSSKTRAALTQLAEAYEAAISDATNTQLSLLDDTAANYGLYCLFYVTPPTSSPSQIMKALEGQVLNTHDRLHAYLTAQSYITTAFTQFPTAQEQKAFCLFNPDLLPN